MTRQRQKDKHWNNGEGWAVPRTVGLVGMLAGLFGCGGALAIGIVTGWPGSKIALFIALSFVYLVVVQSFNFRLALAPTARFNPLTFFLISGAVCLALQTLSGDPYLLPIIFAPPLAGVALIYPPHRTLLVVVYYLSLMGLGLRLSAPPFIEAVLLPMAGYACLMLLIYSFTRVLSGQAAARQRADQLAADLAAQRDYMAQLAQLTANLTRDLDLRAVLEQVAAAGQSLTRAGQARLWLCPTDAPANNCNSDNLRLVAAVPPHNGGDHEAPAAQAEVTALRMVLPLTFKDDTIGVLELRGREDEPFGEIDARLLRPFVDTAAVAIQNARLFEQAGLSATLAERNRLARELHDTIAQGLTAVTMHLEAAQRSLDRYPDRARARLARANELSRQTLADVRRSVWTLAAPLVDGAALAAALDELVQRFAERTGLDATFLHEGPPPPLDPTASTQAMRIVQELLLNVEKHSSAKKVTVALETGSDAVCVSVSDDGVGFDPQAPSSDPTTGSGFGLFSLRERARLAGGTLEIRSTPGTGTRVSLAIPRHIAVLADK